MVAENKLTHNSNNISPTTIPAINRIINQSTNKNDARALTIKRLVNEFLQGREILKSFIDKAYSQEIDGDVVFSLAFKLIEIIDAIDVELTVMSDNFKNIHPLDLINYEEVIARWKRSVFYILKAIFNLTKLYYKYGGEDGRD